MFRSIVLPDNENIFSVLSVDEEFINDFVNLNLNYCDIKSSSSDIFVDDDRQYFVKAIRYKNRFRDNLARFLRVDQPSRELRGIKMLKCLGLRTPDVVAVAKPVNPFGRYMALIYFQYLASTTPLNVFMRQCDDTDLRAWLLREVAGQMKRMVQSGFVFRDFYFGNILLDADLQIVWVDAEVREFSSAERARHALLKKKAFYAERFSRDGGKPSEWESFFSSLH